MDYQVLATVLIAIFATVSVVQSFLLKDMIPVKKVAELIDTLAPLVEKTPTKVDDALLDTARDLLSEVPSE